jgi:aminoglycoside phosphotransferase (APT) family kinase protein
MDRAIKHHLGKDIKEQTRLTGGYTFQTWLLTLSDDTKVVFRTQKDFDTGGGRKIIIADVLERERYFYNTVNKNIGRICPEVFVIDSTREHLDMSYCIMEYIEGTPLALCFRDFDTRTKNDILYKIGGIAAKINGIEIDGSHPYVSDRNSWEEYIADRLYERFKPFICEIITQTEADKITNSMRRKKAAKTLSFVHLDLRHVNMIYNNGDIFVLDAENCEFGDPLFELATIDVAGELGEPLLKGYNDVLGGEINLDDELYLFYKMERLALVLYVFMEEIKNDAKLTEYYLQGFLDIKNKLL